MKRCLFLASLFFVSTATAHADYVLIKVDINKLSFFPVAPEAPAPGSSPMPGVGMMGGFPMPGGAGMAGGIPMPGGGGGGMRGGSSDTGGPGGGMRGGSGGGGAVGMQGGAGAVGAMPQIPPPPNLLMDSSKLNTPDDPNAKWLSAIVEIKNVSKPVPTPLGKLFHYDHKWGKNVWIMQSQLFPYLAGFLAADPFEKEFSVRFNKEKGQKTKSIDNLLHLARWTLGRGQLKEFHKVMDEAEKADPKHAIVKNYVRLRKELSRPFNGEDPGQRDLLEEMRKAGYKSNVSKRSHYCMYAQTIGADAGTETIIARRLALLEETLDTFYYWFCLKEGSPQPALPKHRLNVILAGTKEEFLTRHLQWGSLPMVADGFTPRRDNIIVMSSKPRINDAAYHEFDAILTTKLQEINAKLQPFQLSLTREDLLSGKISEDKRAGGVAAYVAAAQTAVLLTKTLEDEAERHTVTNEAVRQLLTASEMFPRNVQVPEWVVEGLAAFFETPAGGLYPTVGTKSWTHLISFKHFQKTKRLSNPPDVLQNVITDAYFQDARQMSRDSLDKRDNLDQQRVAKDAWELARCTSWAFVYYLSEKGKLDYLFNYGKELNQLPRDMDLNDYALQTSFARAFDMTDPREPRQIDEIKKKNMAGYWFELMQGANMENGSMQLYFEAARARQDVVNSEGGAPATDPNIPAPKDPMPPMPGITPPGSTGGAQTLGGSTWAGSETLQQYGKLTFQFAAGGQVTMIDKDGPSQGTYTQNGNSVTLKFSNDTVSYNGTIQGNKMQGSATNGQNNWNWNVTRNGGNPGINPGNPAGGNRPNPRPPAPRPGRPNGKF